MGEHESPRRWTILVVMLGITFALIVVGVMVILQMRTKQLAYNRNCGMCQSQIMGALVAYSTSEDVAWPTPWAQGPGLAAPKIVDAHAARTVTCRAFEILAATQTLPYSLFRCSAAHRSMQITLKAAADGRNGGRWGMGPEGMVMYAWDWASPADPSSARVMIADRDPLMHGNGVMACFGDAHVKKLKYLPQPVVRPPTALVTEGIDGKPVTVGVGNPEMKGEVDDDIYSDVGDRGDPLRSIGGDERRTWVK